MKTALFLFASTLLAPAAFVVGIAAAPIVGAATLIGLGSIVFQDYGRTPAYAFELATTKVASSSEHLPFAA